MSKEWTEAVRISINGHIDLAAPPSPCLRVQTLLIRDSNGSALPTKFLQFMNALGILDLSKNRRLDELPSGIGSLINLHYLNLSFTNIKQLPLESKNLENLVVLLVDYTGKLQIIPKEVISSFSSLQVFSKLAMKPSMTQPCYKSWNALTAFEGILKIPVPISFRMVHLEELIAENCKHLQFETEDSQYYVLNIRGLWIWRCSTLDNLRWLIFPRRLETLDVRSCASLLHVIGNDFEDLPWLLRICPRVLRFPTLEDVLVIDCPNLLKLPVDPHSARRLREIKSRNWWEQLHWEPEDIVFRDALALKFQDDCPNLGRLTFDSDSAKNLNEIEEQRSWWNKSQSKGKETEDTFSQKYLKNGTQTNKNGQKIVFNENVLEIEARRRVLQIVANFSGVDYIGIEKDKSRISVQAGQTEEKKVGYAKRAN
ncbi:probable disease resistance protein At1g61310 [Hevea brasiliensis]|uniref:probable disease resistance protein At1g61310 n=1 Tax=Hevea brasiliensis TaxID=3981 RepID=UPI0025EA3C09|nr:probable disease resistance protein At1g61310 [Hevea brasiliensis]